MTLRALCPPHSIVSLIGCITHGVHTDYLHTSSVNAVRLEQRPASAGSRSNGSQTPRASLERRCIVTTSSYTVDEDFGTADAVFDCIGDAGDERFSLHDLTTPGELRPLASRRVRGLLTSLCYRHRRSEADRVAAGRGHQGA